MDSQTDLFESRKKMKIWGSALDTRAARTSFYLGGELLAKVDTVVWLVRSVNSKASGKHGQ